MIAQASRGFWLDLGSHPAVQAIDSNYIDGMYSKHSLRAAYFGISRM